MMQARACTAPGCYRELWMATALREQRRFVFDIANAGGVEAGAKRLCGTVLS
jgi:hypothetical protein